MEILDSAKVVRDKLDDNDKKTISIQPFRASCNATTTVPGSKSISNRALILSVMCNARVELEGLLQSEDVDLMRKALENLGVYIQKSGNNYIAWDWWFNF